MASSITSTPSSRALSSFEPALVAGDHQVGLLGDRAGDLGAGRLEQSGRFLAGGALEVPVSTTVLPAKGLAAATTGGGVCREGEAVAAQLLEPLAVAGVGEEGDHAFGHLGPISGIRCSSSALAAASRSSSP